MTVKELIDKLKQYDEEDEVIIADYEDYRAITGIDDFPDYVIILMED